MARIKSMDKIAAKFASVTPQRTQDYEDGIRSPTRSWAAGAAAAAGAYKDGVTKAANAGRFEKGVQKAGDAKWIDGALNKGVGRWGAGVAMSQDRYAAGFEPYRRAIAAVNLPPRQAKRDPRNMQRSQAIVDAMIKQKIGSTS